MIDFLTSETAPWWSGLLGIIVGSIGTYLTTKKSDERNFVEERQKRKDEQRREQEALSDQREHDSEQRRRAEVREAIAGLVAASTRCDETAWALVTEPGESSRRTAYGALSDVTLHFSRLQLLVEGPVLPAALAVHNAAMDLNAEPDRRTLPTLTQKANQARVALVGTAKANPTFRVTEQQVSESSEDSSTDSRDNGK